MYSMERLSKGIILGIDMSLQQNCSEKSVHIYQKETHSKMLIHPFLLNRFIIKTKQIQEKKKTFLH